MAAQDRGPGTKGSLVVVGTGIRTVGQLTVESIAWIESADRVFYVVGDPIAEATIHRLNPNGAETMADAIRVSQAPVIFSHSSARAVYDHSRNLSDEELLAVKENGGVVQAVAFRAYVNGDKHRLNREALLRLQSAIAESLGYELLDQTQLQQLDEAARAAYAQRMNEINELAAPRIDAEVNAIAPPVDVSDFVDHIDYMVEKIGIEHVGISSDFDGGGGIEDWMDASETFNITLELVKRGYSEEEIAKLWGENLLRVLDEVQEVAKELQKS